MSTMGQYFDEHDERLQRYSFIDSLEDADSEREVVGIVRDYFARLGPTELATLPEDCWPGKITDREDIADYALRVARRRALSPQSVADDALLDRIHNLLSHAAARVAVLATRPASAGDTSVLDEAVGRPEEDI
jgi:hypothetical protein